MKTLIALMAGLLLALAPALPASATDWDSRIPLGHWGVEPYYGSGVRYVWLIDHTTGTDRLHVQDFVNGVNAWYNTNYSLPYILYYTAESVGLPTGYDTCDDYPTAQVISVCMGNTWAPELGRYTAGRAVTISDDYNGHAWAKINPNLSFPYRADVIKHELGHTYGFGHRTGSCASLMGGSQCGSNIGSWFDNHDIDSIQQEYHLPH